MNPNVMIVEDSGQVRKILERTLRQARAGRLGEIVEAADGVMALKKLGTTNVHLIFCDVHLPNMDGLEFLRRLKVSKHKGIPVVMITSEDRAEMVRQAINLGANGYIRKPFTQDQVEGMLAKLLP